MLTIRARLALTYIVSQQRGSLDDSELWADIRNTIAVPKELQEQVIKTVDSTHVLVDVARMDAESDSQEFSFEKHARRKLLDVLKGWSNYEPDDSKWNRKFVEELESSLK